MKKIFYTCSLLAIITFALSSCQDKDPLVITGPDGALVKWPGRVVLSADGLPAGASAELLDAAGIKHADILAGGFADVESGTYNLVVITPRDGLTVSNTTASLSAADATMVPQAPQFSAGLSTVTAVADRTVEAWVPLSPMTREVHFKVSISGVDVTAISSVEIALYGVACRVDVSKGFGAVLSEATDTGYYTTAVQSPYVPDGIIPMRLLGMLSERPRVEVKVVIGDNQYIYKDDTTEGLEEFNKGNPDEPVELEVDLDIDPDDPEGVKVTGTIKPWDKGKEVEIDGE